MLADYQLFHCDSSTATAIYPCKSVGNILQSQQFPKLYGCNQKTCSLEVPPKKQSWGNLRLAI
jgi:hypothetical protein